MSFDWREEERHQALVELEKCREENAWLGRALKKPLKDTILAVLVQMPQDADPGHLAMQIERQVRAWQAIPYGDKPASSKTGSGDFSPYDPFGRPSQSDVSA